MRLAWLHAQLTTSNRPLIVGPFRSEVGFECLYWVPWLAQLRHQWKLPRERVIALSRGGAGIWYDAAQAVDLYNYVPADRLRKAQLVDSASQRSIKQWAVTPWERALLPVIAQDLGLRRYHWLHPSLMYRTLAPWWDGQQGLSWISQRLRFAPLPVPHPPLELPLPSRYVAVRFYARYTWPMRDELKVWVANLVDQIASHIPVVVLRSPFHVDDHQDFPVAGPNILDLAPYVTVQTSLAVQSAVLAKADAFVGTYGGTLQLAVRLGRPAIGFYEKFQGTAPAHKTLTEAIAMQQDTPLAILTPKGASFIGQIMGAAEPTALPR